MANDSEGVTIEVDIVKIDDIVPKDREASILHLDVEGFEKQALTGGLETIKK
ncbi:MAG: FkbM family methyltransferase [Owenweeksia sp.]|nr:FkbM family methyltransferase [Owenweeksia sp.]